MHMRKMTTLALGTILAGVLVAAASGETVHYGSEQRTRKTLKGHEIQRHKRRNNQRTCPNAFSANFFNKTNTGLAKDVFVSCRQNSDCVTFDTKDDSRPCCLHPYCVCGGSSRAGATCISPVEEDFRSLMTAKAEAISRASDIHNLLLLEKSRDLTSALPPIEECTDHPDDWHDADGPLYNCEWYAKKDRCMKYGHMYENQGYAANEACCVCGGGIPTQRSVDLPPPTETPTSPPTASPTQSPTTSTPTESPTDTSTSPSHVPSTDPTTSLSPTSSNSPTSPSVFPSVSSNPTSSSSPSMSISPSSSINPTLSSLPSVSTSPTFSPSQNPTLSLSPSVSTSPSIFPSDSPSAPPTLVPSSSPSFLHTFPVPTQYDSTITYNPGNFSMGTRLRDKYGREVIVSNGLYGRAIAYTNETVFFTDGTLAESSDTFHDEPDGAAAFASADGGFYYTSNAEVPRGRGGVYSIKFDSRGEVIDYFTLLTNTSRNCGGGRTPWGSWVSCEENGRRGQCWQCDPSGVKTARRTNVVAVGGNYESFAYDTRYPIPRFFTTEDSKKGALVRFTPDKFGMICYSALSNTSKWCTLEYGTHDYLQLHPIGDGSSGTFAWVQNKTEANPSRYPLSEGIDVVNGLLHFTCKRSKRLFILDLDNFTYTRHSTESGAFDKKPDQIATILNDPNGIVYFCEEGGRRSGVHGRDDTARYFSILDGPGYRSETTGLTFSPDAKFMLVSFQGAGVIWQFWRTDGMMFHGSVLDIKYHEDKADQE